VLLEVLPALAILLLALMGSMRLAWTAMEHQRSLANARWCEQVLPLVWRKWASEASELAVVRKTANELDIRYFPNLAWLPEGVPGAAADHVLILRREPTHLGVRPAWRIRRRTGSGNNWETLLVVLEASDSTGGDAP
jgi:hypothetical protein